MKRYLGQMERRLGKLRDQIERMPPKIKRDGNLDKDKHATVKINEYPHVVIASRGDEEVVYTEVVHLTIEQALSLRDWLIQETSILEQLAEEHNHD